MNRFSEAAQRLRQLADTLELRSAEHVPLPSGTDLLAAADCIDEAKGGCHICVTVECDRTKREVEFFVRDQGYGRLGGGPTLEIAVQKALIEIAGRKLPAEQALEVALPEPVPAPLSF